VANRDFVWDAAVFGEDGQPLVRIGPSRWVSRWDLNFDIYSNPVLNPTWLDFFRKACESALQEVPAGRPNLMTCDGLDNHGGGAMCADLRAEDFPFAIVPLVHGKDSKKPCLAFLGHAFLRELDKLRREHGLYYQANAQHAFARCAIYADVQFCDIFMIEWGGSASEEVTHEVSRYMRTICHQKMVRYWPAFGTLPAFVNEDPEGQGQAIDQHFQRGLFWGILPGFGWVPEVEKYRDLYKKMGYPLPSRRLQIERLVGRRTVNERRIGRHLVAGERGTVRLFRKRREEGDSPRGRRSFFPSRETACGSLGAKVSQVDTPMTR